MTTFVKHHIPLWLALLLPARLVGQSPGDREALEQLRATLALARSPAEVRSIPLPAKAGPSALFKLRQGLVQLRLGELSGDRARYDEALMRFDQAQLAEPAWPYPWFGIALAKQGLHRRDLLVKSSRTQEDGLSYFQGYTQAFKEIFARDPEFGPALDQLRQTILEQGERNQPKVLMDPFRAMGMGSRGTQADALILSRDFRRRNHPDSALIAINRYLERGGDRGVASLEKARILASFGSPAAAEQSYLEGLSDWSVDGRTAYRADLGWIATPEELEEFDRASDSTLGQWIREFWRWRDVEETRGEGERLQEHLRRWAYVDTHFRVVSPERRTIFSRVFIPTAGPCSRGDYYLADDILGDSTVRPWDGRHRERLYDDRAYVYMRHGEPADRVEGLTRISETELKTNDSTVRDAEKVDPGVSLADMLLDERKEDARANESWLYWIKGERRIYHFEGSRILGLAGPTTLAIQPLEDGAWLETRGRLDPLYLKAAHSMSTSPVPFLCQRLVQQVMEKARTDANVALRTDSYTLLYPTELAPVVQMYAMGRPDEDGRILVVYAVPGANLQAETDSAARVVYHLATRLGATDSIHHIAIAFDTIRHFVASDTIREGSHLTGLLELPVPAGLYRLASRFSQPGTSRGSTVVRTGLDLQVRSDGLYLSDLVLGRDGSSLVWNYRGTKVPLNPLGAFPRDSSAEVFYELSGLKEGRSYVTSMELAPLKKAKSEKESIRLRFTFIADTEVLPIRRTLGLNQLERGQYRLTVEVTEEGSSRKVRREQTLTVTN